MQIFTLCDEPTERHVCSDGLTVIEKTQICDDVPDCPVNNNSYYLVAEDESFMCPGNFLSFRPFVIKNVMILKYVNTESLIFVESVNQNVLNFKKVFKNLAKKPVGSKPPTGDLTSSKFN